MQRPCFAAILGILLFVVTISPCPGKAPATGLQEDAAAIAVEAASPTTTLNPLLFGQNLLFAGNGLWNVKINALDPAGVKLVKNLAPTIIRFPGGSAADLYFWEDGLGYHTTAEVTPNSPSIPLNGSPSWPPGSKARIIAATSGTWGDPFNFLTVEQDRLLGIIGLKSFYPAGAEVRLEKRAGQPDWFTNTYGILEFLKTVSSLGAQALITVNYGTGLDKRGQVSTTVSLSQKVKRAAALVALVNGSPGDPRPLGVDEEGHDWRTVGYWAGLRASRGQPQPGGVRYWEVGNEVYDKTEAGFTNAAKYAEDLAAFAQAMKAVDPAIKLGAVGVTFPRGKGAADRVREWNPTVLKQAGSHMDFFIVHPYYPGAGQKKVSYKSRAWFTAVMAGSTQAMADLKEIRSIINASIPGRQVGLAITEYGIWPADSKDGRDYSNLARALYDADLLMSLVRKGASLGVILATSWNLHGSNATASILYHWRTGNRTLRPQYFSQELLVKHLQPRILKTRVTSPGFAATQVGNVKAQTDIPLLTALASLSQDRKRLTLAVINRSLDTPVRTAIRLHGFTPQAQAGVCVLGGGSAGEHNEEDPQTIRPLTGALDYAAPQFPFTFKAQSLTLLKFRAKP